MEIFTIMIIIIIVLFCIKFGLDIYILVKSRTNDITNGIENEESLQDKKIKSDLTILIEKMDDALNEEIKEIKEINGRYDHSLFNFQVSEHYRNIVKFKNITESYLKEIEKRNNIET